MPDLGYKDNLGSATHRTALAITSTAQLFTVVGEKSVLELVNTGSKDVYYGGLGVTSTNGIPIYAGMGKRFMDVCDGFNLYLVTDGVDTSTIRVVEYA